MYHHLETRKLNPNKFQVLNIHKKKPNSTDLKISSTKLLSIKKIIKNLDIYIAENIPTISIMYTKYINYILLKSVLKLKELTF